MEARLIKNEDFLQLVNLVHDMYQEMGTELNEFQSVNQLLHQINTQKGFIAVGLYDGTALAGFVLGYEESEKTFYFSGIYVIMKNSESVKTLIDFSFDYIEKLGYTSWEVDATSENIGSIMKKYGAKVKYTRYRKD